MEISSVSSSAVYRPAVPLAEEALSEAASSSSAESSPGAGGFISPVFRYDQRARLAVLFFRDYDTGETREQIPAKRVVEEYQRAAGNMNAAGNDQAGGTGASSAADGSPAASGRAGGSAPPVGGSGPPAAAALSASASGTSAPSGAVVSLTV